VVVALVVQSRGYHYGAAWRATLEDFTRSFAIVATGALNSMDDSQQKKWDVFISHASEDKDTFVRPLAVALQSLGVSVWYDEFSLKTGESLSRSIDHGLVESKYGLVVISPHFLSKPWPEYELRGLVSREIEEDRVILPIWHGVRRKQVLEFSPPLADKIAILTEHMNAQGVAIQILKEVRPDLYAKHPRSYLEKLASGEAIRELQEEIEISEAFLEAANQELSQYRCPFCGSELVGLNDAPVDPDERDWDTVERFACGYQVFAGVVQQPCPADPRFPNWEDFELTYRYFGDQWTCYALGKTDMAKLLPLSSAPGETKEEAAARVHKQYQRYAQKRAR
jgi:hypothetical protein